jgi:hypothetical protein
LCRQGVRPVDAAEYRAKAREMREKAKTVFDLRARSPVLVIAEQYDWLAEWAEEKARETEEFSGVI